MSPEIILGAIVLVPVIVLMFFKINATLVFLSLCLGNVLVQFVAQDAESYLSLFATQANSDVEAGSETIKLILLLLPAVLTALFMIRTVRSKGKLFLNLFPAIGVGMLGGLLVVPLLPGDMSESITEAALWGQAQQAQNLIVGVSAIICLFVLWLQRPKAGGGGEEKHGKHKG
jgi:hypothetical protein